MKLTVIECYWTPDGKSRAALVKLKPWFGEAKEVLFTNTSGNGREEKDMHSPGHAFELAFRWFDAQGREVSDHGFGLFSIGLSEQLDRAFDHARAAGTVKELSDVREYAACLEAARRELRKGRD